LVEHPYGRSPVQSWSWAIRRKVKYYVYILKSKIVDRYYVGSTTSLERRLTEHNNRRKHWTSRFQPWEMIYYEECDNRAEVVRRERKLKSRNGIAEKLKIIGKKVV
jgi:putative endonuclease